jgi:hypothetical protein
VLPVVRSVRTLGVLKKAYTQDIHWKEAPEESSLGYQLSSDRAQLKHLLNQITGGNCCNPVSF